jgi:hypothetical protein
MQQKSREWVESLDFWGICFLPFRIHDFLSFTYGLHIGFAIPLMMAILFDHDFFYYIKHAISSSLSLSLRHHQ